MHVRLQMLTQVRLLNSAEKQKITGGTQSSDVDAQDAFVHPDLESM